MRCDNVRFLRHDMAIIPTMGTRKRCQVTRYEDGTVMI